MKLDAVPSLLSFHLPMRLSARDAILNFRSFHRCEPHVQVLGVHIDPEVRRCPLIRVIVATIIFFFPRV